MARSDPPKGRRPFRRDVRRSQSTRRTPVAIRVAARVEASAERVFNAWLDAECARRWLFATATRPVPHVEIDARVGGAFRFVERLDAGDVLEHRGEYVAIVPYRRLVFTLAVGDRRAATCVSVEIEPHATGCSLTLVHENVPLDVAHGIETRWAGMLYGLGVTLDAIGNEPIAGRLPLGRHGPLRRPALGDGRSP